MDEGPSREASYQGRLSLSSSAGRTSSTYSASTSDSSARLHFEEPQEPTRLKKLLKIAHYKASQNILVRVLVKYQILSLQFVRFETDVTVYMFSTMLRCLDYTI